MRTDQRVKVGALRFAEHTLRYWRDLAAREQLQKIGTEWARKRTGAVLSVPSAVIPPESNYLLNPLHPDFKRIEIGKPEAFVTGVRLLKK